MQVEVDLVVPKLQILAPPVDTITGSFLNQASQKLQKWNNSDLGKCADFYKKACDVFNSAYNSLYIWDFSGQTTQLLINDKARVSNDSPVNLEKR
ncbi:hypothetical protein KIW84_031173 [Lathyrus oleraceus]|uniref:UBP8/5-like ubiquitin-like domain-containing protein n=1 Tax=Pisum sativum TaxID=3888 RepID=A0A9D4XSF9_PEA|nr:hypothetical protein KIW84_031173 [Pisum sativum]